MTRRFRTRGTHTVRRRALAAIAACAMLAAMLRARLGDAQACTEPFRDLCELGQALPRAGATIAVTPLVILGIASDGLVLDGLARGVGVPRGWAVYGTIFWGLGVVASAVGTRWAIDWAVAWTREPAWLALAIPSLAVSLASLAVSIVGLANPPRVTRPGARPARRVATSWQPTLSPVLSPSGVGLAGVF